MFFDVFEYMSHWPASNYGEPELRGHGSWGVTAVFWSMATISVWVRLWQRLYVRRWFGFDDFLILLSWLCSIGITVIVGLGNAHYGWDRHLWDLDPALYSRSAHLLYIARLMWGMATSFVRLSVICLYYRLLNSAKAPKRYFFVTHLMLASTILLLLYYIFSQVFACAPIWGYWAWPTPADLDIKCMDDGLSLTVSAGVNTLSEFAVATLPLVAVFRLRVDHRQQWAVIGVLCLGYIVVVAGCVRTFFVWKVFHSWDLTWWATPQWLATEVELDLAIVCACAAPLRPVITRIARLIRGQRQPQMDKPTRSWFRAQKPIPTMSQTSGSTLVDQDGINEWTSKMSRTIDLEGIRADGFGYTVKITGPTKPDPFEQLHLNLVKVGLTSAPKSRPASRAAKSRPASQMQSKIKRHNSSRIFPNDTPPPPTKRMDITAETEVEIRQSWHTMEPPPDKWNTTTVTDHEFPGWDSIALSDPNHLFDNNNNNEPAETQPAYHRPVYNREDSDTYTDPHPRRQHNQALTSQRLRSNPSQTPLHDDSRYRDLSVNPNFFESEESLDALPPMSEAYRYRR